MTKKLIIVLAGLHLVISCKQKADAPAEPAQAEVRTPVTVTGINTAPVTEYVELSATSTILQKSIIKSSTAGFVKIVNGQLGNAVTIGEELFTVKTKEAQYIGNAISSLDSTFKFTGLIHIHSNANGYITELDHHEGDYVQDGEQLAIVSDMNSFVFVLNLPYELRPYVLNKHDVLLSLPDGKSLRGYVSYVTPVVDSASQTQNIYLKVNEKNLPINLIAKVKIEKISKTNTQTLPKPAVLSDETQTNFWVMKVLDTATAVKVPVTKGLETGDRVEILTPKFTTEDRFLLTGNYGLGDTAKINILKQ